MGFYYLYVILAYLLVLTGYNIYKSRQVKSQDDFMVAGRSLSLTKMVFTLVCTWIGSGTFIAGAEYASYAGWSAIWQPAGAFLGIAIIYFVAARIRTFGQYTVGRHPRGALRPVRPAVRRDRADHRLHDDRRLPVPGRRLHPERGHRRRHLAGDGADDHRAVRHPVRHHRRHGRRGAHRPAERHHHRVGLPAGAAVRRHRRRRLGARARRPRADQVPGVRAGLREVPGAEGLLRTSSRRCCC